MKRTGSLGARVALIMVGGVLLGQLISVGVMMTERVLRAPDSQASVYAARVSELVQLLDTLDRAGRERLARDSRPMRLVLDPPLDPAPDSRPGSDRPQAVISAAERRFLETTGNLLAKATDPPRTYTLGVLAVPPMPPPDGPVRMVFRIEGGPPISGPTLGPPPVAWPGGIGEGAPREHGPGAPGVGAPGLAAPDELSQLDLGTLLVGTTLSDGQRVELQLGLRRMNGYLAQAEDLLLSRGFPRPLAYGLLVLTAVLIVTSLLATHWVVRPLRQLADAADALGRDLRREPLRETGPTEVNRAARAFNRMQDQLLRLIDGRTEALAAMSHDMRTPVTRIRLRAELLPDTERDRLVADLAEVETLIDQTLDYMRGIDDAEAETLFSGAELVERCVDEFAETGQDIATGTLEELWISARQSLLRRALTNLVQNAVKYGCDPCISLYADGGETVSSVQDRGPGVPPSLLNQLTRPFFRVESSRNRSTGGTGLGLAIVKGIAERHGGRLVLRNRQGGGFEAELRLPAKP